MLNWVKLVVILINYFVHHSWTISTITTTSINAKNHHVQLGLFPPTCERIECPTYDLIEVGKDYKIRRYNSSMWMSTAPIDDISLVQATRTGFIRRELLQRENRDDSTSIGRSETQRWTILCIIVRGELLRFEGEPAKSTAGTIPARAEMGETYVAVRQFGGFVSDSDVGKEAVALSGSLQGMVWLDAIMKSHGGENTTMYAVAQYNSPFEFKGRVNEVWFTFHQYDDAASKSGYMRL